MGIERYNPISHDFIEYVLNKKKYLYALILIDSYLDHYAAWCYRNYYKNDKTRLNEYFKKGFKIKYKWLELINNLPNFLPEMYKQNYSKKYKYKYLSGDIKKFRYKRNIIVHEVMGFISSSLDK